MFELIAFLVPGTLIILQGVMLVISKNPAPLHPYHRTLTAPSDLPHLAVHTGWGLIISGLGIFIAGLSFVFPKLRTLCLVVGVAVILAGIIYALVAIKRYNHKIISW